MIKKVLTLVLTLALLTGCAALPGMGETNLNIVVTDFPCYDFARAVVGDAAKITLLIKPGQEVHSFDPSPEDIVSVMDADLFIYIGGESDVWADDILSSLGNDAPAVARMFDSIDPLEEETVEGMESGEEEGEGVAYDEHIWTSPVNAAKMVYFIRDKLVALDPANETTYTANADAYAADIVALDTSFRNIVASARRKEFIFGDRFPFLYFAREYGLTYYAAFPGCTSETEPSAQTVTFLIDKIVTDDIPVVYQIELSNGNIAKTIAAETGVDILTFQSLQNVTQTDFEAGETYVTLMQKNVEALERGLN